MLFSALAVAYSQRRKDCGASLLDAASRWLDALPPVRGLKYATVAVAPSAARLMRVMVKADVMAFVQRWTDLEQRLAGEPLILRDVDREVAASPEMRLI